MSDFSFVKLTNEFEVWVYVPDLFHAFPFRMEKIRLPWRIRCVMEYFVGYRVFYIKKGEKWAGYCVVSNGRNPRYRFSTDKDIIFGRYYIAKECRGNHLASRMLKEILDNCGLQYEHAYAYLKTSNTASIHTMKRIGAQEVKHFNIKGLIRSLHDQDDGEFTLYEYTKGKQ